MAEHLLSAGNSHLTSCESHDKTFHERWSDVHVDEVERDAVGGTPGLVQHGLTTGRSSLRGRTEGSGEEVGRSLRAAAGAYLSARRHELAVSSRKSTYIAIESLLDSVGEIRASNLKRAHIITWLQHRAGEISPNTLRGNLSKIRKFTEWMVMDGWIKQDPCLGVQRVKVPRSLPRELSPEAVTKTLLSADLRGEAIWLLIVGSGLRVGEVARLQIHDIDWDLQTVFVVGKGGHERVVPFTDEARTALSNYLASSPCAAGPVFRSYKDERSQMTPDHISDMIRGWMRDAGIKERMFDGVSAHAGRHTAAGELLDAGADLRDVQNFLGHTSLSTTSIYTKRRENVDRLRDLERREYRP